MERLCTPTPQALPLPLLQGPRGSGLATPTELVTGELTGSEPSQPLRTAPHAHLRPWNAKCSVPPSPRVSLTRDNWNLQGSEKIPAVNCAGGSEYKCTCGDWGYAAM